MRAPSQNPVTLKFGATTDPYSPANPHKGTDYSYQPNDTIYAPFSGKVTQAFNDRDGNGTYMTDPQGRFHGLLHASRYLVPNGTIVTEGEAIAVMGETGFAQGKHLHWAVKQNGVFIDPESILKGEEDMQPTPKQVGDVYRFMTGNEISQKDLDFYITAPRTIYDLIYALGPTTQSKVSGAKQSEVVQLLEKERDSVLYPFVNAVWYALGLSGNPDATKLVKVTDAIKAKGGTPKVEVNGQEYVPKT